MYMESIEQESSAR